MSEMSAFVRALFGGAAAAAFVFAGACYDYSSPGNVEEPSLPSNDAGARDVSQPTEDAPSTSDDVADPPLPPCAIGAIQCGDKIGLRADTVYRCSDAGTGELIERCANGCANDTCNPPTACHPGGAYCGGDKINGDPDVLYRCVDGGAPTVIQRCPNACEVNLGLDDSCR
jgi:hypothetical protein